MDHINIKVEEGKLIWFTDEETVHNIALSEVKVIAEYSTPDGPKKGDWFLKLILSDTQSYEMSMYNEDINQITTQIGEYLKVSIVTKLSGQKVWNSNVLFPKALQGQSLWHIEEIPPRGILDWIKTFLFLGKRLDFRLTDAVNKLVNASK